MKSKELFPPVFSRHARDYKQRLDEIMARGEARGRQRAIDLLAVEPGMRVLDLACGPGTLSGPLAARVGPRGEVVGVDLATGMIELARAAGIANARFEVMDIEQLELPDASFDAAACGHGLQFAGDLPRALSEARRVLRPGGRFAASVPVTGPGQRPWTVLEQVVDRWLPPAPVAVDQRATRDVIGDAGAFHDALLASGFGRATVEVVDEKVIWPSADELVARCMSWWDLASRVDGLPESKRQDFMADAVTSVKKEHPRTIETFARNHVVLAVA